MAIITQFSADYGRRFGQGSEAPEAGIRINTVRVQSYVELETVNLSNVRPTGETRAAGKPSGTRKCWFVGHADAIDTALYDHAALEPGMRVPGPAVIVSATTTYLVEPNWSVEIGEYGAAWFKRTTPVSSGKTAADSAAVKAIA